MIHAGKKAVVSDMGRIIIIAVTVVILLLFVPKLWAVIKEKSVRETCKASVSAQAALMSVPKGTNIIQPECKTFNVVFYNNRVEISGEKASVYDSREKAVVKDFKGLTNDIVNQVVAEELKECWYEFLKGKNAVIDRRNWISLSLYSPKLCFLCDEISFDSSVSQQEFTGFYQYTKNTTMPNSQLTYYQYYAEQPRMCEYYTRTASDYSGTNCWEDFFIDQITKKDPQFTPENTVFNTNGEKYIVTFIAWGLARKGGVAVEGEVDNFAYVLPYSDLKNQCDRFIRGLE